MGLGRGGIEKDGEGGLGGLGGGGGRRGSGYRTVGVGTYEGQNINLSRSMSAA